MVEKIAEPISKEMFKNEIPVLLKQNTKTIFKTIKGYFYFGVSSTLKPGA